MTEREQWTESLRCPKCGMTGSVELSQANGQAFHDGDQEVRVESLPDGFKVVELVVEGETQNEAGPARLLLPIVGIAESC